VWKRCTQPRADHDCFGREAIAVVDGADNRFVTLGAVTGSRQQPSLGDDGLLREVGDGLWYWAHLNPGPYLVSATMSQPVQVSVMDGPVAHSFGVPSIECPDQVGLCTLEENARTLGRLAVPDVPDTRWATPTAEGCGLWGLAGVSGKRECIAVASGRDDTAQRRVINQAAVGRFRRKRNFLALRIHAEIENEIAAGAPVA
jgi:hypothetical protein